MELSVGAIPIRLESVNYTTSLYPCQINYTMPPAFTHTIVRHIGLKLTHFKTNKQSGALSLSLQQFIVASQWELDVGDEGNRNRMFFPLTQGRLHYSFG